MKAGRIHAGGSRHSDCAARTTATMMAVSAVMMFAATMTLAPRASWAAGAGSNPVVAAVGDRQITQSELDAAVLQSISKSQLYDLRKQTLDKMVDTYLIDAAAKKANLTPDAYLARELHSKGSQVTEADARKYYDAHKAGIDAETNGKSFNDIKPLLINALQRH